LKKKSGAGAAKKFAGSPALLTSIKEKAVFHVRSAKEEGKRAVSRKSQSQRVAEPGRRPSPAKAAPGSSRSPAAASSRRRPSQKRSGLSL